jgi:hypothetical protein
VELFSPTCLPCEACEATVSRFRDWSAANRVVLSLDGMLRFCGGRSGNTTSLTAADYVHAGEMALDGILAAGTLNIKTTISIQ